MASVPLKKLNNPFPPFPACLPFVHGTLIYNASDVPSCVIPVGKNFLVKWSPEAGGLLSVFHRSEPGRSLWSSIPYRCFVSAAAGESTVEESRGSFAIHDKLKRLLMHQTLSSIELLNLPSEGRDSSATLFSAAGPSVELVSPSVGRDQMHDGDASTSGTVQATVSPAKDTLARSHEPEAGREDASGAAIPPGVGRRVRVTCRSAQSQDQLERSLMSDNGPQEGEAGMCAVFSGHVCTSWQGARSLVGLPTGTFGFLGTSERPQPSDRHSSSHHPSSALLGDSVAVEYVLEFREESDNGIAMTIRVKQPVAAQDEPGPASDPSFGHVSHVRHKRPRKWLLWERFFPQHPDADADAVNLDDGTEVERQGEEREAGRAQEERADLLGWLRGIWPPSTATPPLSLPLLGDTVGWGRRRAGIALPLHINRVQLTYASRPRERFFGFGEQFSHFDLKGRRVPILVQEQGVGRGDQPITLAANIASFRGGGSWYTTYAPVPQYITSDLHCFFLSNYEYSVFDLRHRNRVQVQVHSSCLSAHIIHGRSPTELLSHYTASPGVGRMRPLPSWATKGAIVGMQGGSNAVAAVWDRLRAEGVPISAFWLQDWCGQRRTSFGKQLWWNWELDRDHYPNWEAMVAGMRGEGVRVMAYCNPYLAQVDEKSNKTRDLYAEASASPRGMLVLNSSGRPYMIENTSFHASMVDLSSPVLRSWLKGVLREMVEMGISGWMADFGEALPFDAVLYSGEDPASAHNKYPELWSQLNREVVEEMEEKRRVERQGRSMVGGGDGSLEGQGILAEDAPAPHPLPAAQADAEYNADDDASLLFFMRAGFRGSPSSCPLFWTGDQMVSWQRHDGIKSAVTALLSSGMSGFALNHSDIGGYTTILHPLIKYARGEELLLRWMELNAFSVLFRTHEGNLPSANAQFYSTDAAMAHFSRFARVFKAWHFYRRQLVEEASETGLPVVRHLFLHYPHDPKVHAIVYEQFLVGSELLVAPVLNPRTSHVSVYIPPGHTWQHVWSGKEFTPSKGGTRYRVAAPVGFPAVFFKKGSDVGSRLMRNLETEGLL